MRTIGHRTFPLFLLGALLAPAAPAAEPGGGEMEEFDMVRVRDSEVGVRMTVIEAEDYESVRGKYKNAAVKVPSHKVVDVQRVARSDHYDTAVEWRRKERFTLAAKYFVQALDAMKDKPWAVEYCNYGLAESLYEAGLWQGYAGRTYTYQPPAHYYAAAIKANPKSRFLLDACVKKAVCLIEEGKADAAETALAEALAAVKQYREDTVKTGDLQYRQLADRAEAHVKLARAKLLERKTERDQAGQKPDFGEALTAAKAAQTTAAGKFPDLFAEGVEIELRCLFRNSAFEEAKARAEGIIDKYQKDCDVTLLPMLPAAYATIGRASYAIAVQFEAKGNTLQANQAYSQSRWNYLQVLVQFFDKDEYLPEAAFYVGECYNKLRSIEKDAGEKAVRYWRMVKKSYADSPFAKRAAEELQRLGVPDEETPAAKVDTKDGGEAKAAPASAKADAKGGATAKPAEPAKAGAKK